MLKQMRAVVGSIDELVGGAQRREPFVNLDARSASTFERVWIGGEPHIVKYVHPDQDFTMRVSGDIGHRTARAWAAGLLDSAPELVDHGIVGAAIGLGRNGWGSALLMRDLSDELLPLGGAKMAPADHAAFVDHVGGFCAATWGWRDDHRAPLYLPYRSRWEWFGDSAIEGERSIGFPELVPRLAAQGWDEFDQRAPADIAAALRRLRRDVTPLVSALRTTPSCFLHGDIKSSNTGVAVDGRTVLIDWAYVGEGPACHELAWHLALDRERLPISKAETVQAFRESLAGHGVDTGGWWTSQLELCLLGAVVQFGWEKAFGDADELRWWCAAARRGLRHL